MGLLVTINLVISVHILVTYSCHVFLSRRHPVTSYIIFSRQQVRCRATVNSGPTTGFRDMWRSVSACVVTRVACGVWRSLVWRVEVTRVACGGHSCGVWRSLVWRVAVTRVACGGHSVLVCACGSHSCDRRVE